MKILVCGGREWTNADLILDVLTALRSHVSLVIEGECRGADLMSRHAAESLHIPVKKFPANWQNGISAGPQRNSLMLKEKPDVIIGFHDNIEKSIGTKDMIAQARRRYIPTFLFSSSMEKDQIAAKIIEIQQEAEDGI